MELFSLGSTGRSKRAYLATLTMKCCIIETSKSLILHTTRHKDTRSGCSARRLAIYKKMRGNAYDGTLKGLSHEIDFKTFDKILQNFLSKVFEF
jgi:hypothetical protein